MPTKKSKLTSGELFIRAAIAAALGMGLTLLLSALGAFLISNGTLGERVALPVVLLSVFIGCYCSSLNLERYARIGILPGIFITASCFLLLLLVLSALSQQKLLGPNSGYVASIALIGALAGQVTNLVKSNKSYINKSKRKRLITKRNHI